jgi:hypothetical protein
MLHIEDREIERRLEALGAHTPQAKVGLARQMLLHASEKMVTARALISTELLQAESEPLLELTAELWEEILTGPPREGDLDRPLGLGVPPEASRLTLREFLAGSKANS